MPYCHATAFLIVTDLLCPDSLNEHINGCEPLWADFLLHQVDDDVAAVALSVLHWDQGRRGVCSAMGSTAAGQHGGWQGSVSNAWK